jgi:hypothetical protein
MKQCKKCGIEKPLELFKRYSENKDGRAGTCKECMYGHKPHNKLLVTEKTCSCCKEIKEINLFPMISKKLQYRSAICKSCRNKRRQEKRAEDPQKEKIRTRKRALQSKYGLTLEDYDNMYTSQQGKCKICNTSYDLLCIDHCHNTSKIRGLLCNSCNTGIGHLKDNVQFLKSAIQYLEDNNC